LICCLTALTIGFYSNFWKAANQDWFNFFQYDSESLVIGKLALSERQSIFSEGGLLGRYYNTATIKDAGLYQYELYKNNSNTIDNNFKTYNSQIGGQAFTFAILDYISPFSNVNNLKIFKLLTSVLTALFLSLILLWFFENIGVGTAIFTLILILFSQWITVFGNNLYWSLWSFYIPFITTLTIFSMEIKKNKTLSIKTIYILVFLSVFLKCFYSGMEYITTTLIMLVIPIFYYASIDNWKLRILFNRILAASVSSIAAIILSFTILSIQLATVKGSMTKGFKHIWYSFIKRTYGDSSDYSDIIKESFDSRLSEVLLNYLNGVAINFNNILTKSSDSELLKIEFDELIILIVLFSCLGLLLSKFYGKYIINTKKTVALITTCWLSILAPLSWIILFKGHSYLHTHMNHIMWYMPFAILGYAVIGHVIFLFSKVIFSYFKTINPLGIIYISFKNINL